MSLDTVSQTHCQPLESGWGIDTLAHGASFWSHWGPSIGYWSQAVGRTEMAHPDFWMQCDWRTAVHSCSQLQARPAGDQLIAWPCLHVPVQLWDRCSTWLLAEPAKGKAADMSPTLAEISGPQTGQEQVEEADMLSSVFIWLYNLQTPAAWRKFHYRTQEGGKKKKHAFYLRMYIWNWKYLYCSDSRNVSGLLVH